MTPPPENPRPSPGKGVWRLRRALAAGALLLVLLGAAWCGWLWLRPTTLDLPDVPLDGMDAPVSPGH